MFDAEEAGFSKVSKNKVASWLNRVAHVILAGTPAAGQLLGTRPSGQGQTTIGRGCRGRQLLGGDGRVAESLRGGDADAEVQAEAQQHQRQQPDAHHAAHLGPGIPAAAIEGGQVHKDRAPETAQVGACGQAVWPLLGLQRAAKGGAPERCQRLRL